MAFPHVNQLIVDKFIEQLRHNTLLRSARIMTCTHLKVLYSAFERLAPELIFGEHFDLYTVGVDVCVKFLGDLPVHYDEIATSFNSKVVSEVRFMRTICGRFKMLLIAFGRNDIVGDENFIRAMRKVTLGHRSTTAYKFFNKKGRRLVAP